MAQAFKLSSLLELEAALACAEAAGDQALVGVAEEPLSDLEWDALERVPESREEIRDLLFAAASRWSTNQTRPSINEALRLADAGDFGVNLAVALRDVGDACVADCEDSLFPRDIATNCRRALMRFCVIEGGLPAR
ncbi:MAG: hypothetical protein P4L80_12155 [Xanthobacteraceae bacterium]|nr:hypothetical protein [Xanthobacteraceae bacterium]